MNNYHIHNTGRNVAPRKPVARLFASIRTGCPENERAIIGAKKRFNSLGTFEERNRKENEACSGVDVSFPKESVSDKLAPLSKCSQDKIDLAGTSWITKADTSLQQVSEKESFVEDSSYIYDDMEARDSAPEFRVGDWVEETADIFLGIPPRAGVFEIEEIDEIDPLHEYLPLMARFKHHSVMWPLRSLRHVEIEPKQEDGWQQIDAYIYGKEWRKDSFRVRKEERFVVVGDWSCCVDGCLFLLDVDGYDSITSWPSCKAAIEKYKERPKVHKQ